MCYQGKRCARSYGRKERWSGIDPYRPLDQQMSSRAATLKAGHDTKRPIPVCRLSSNVTDVTWYPTQWRNTQGLRGSHGKTTSRYNYADLCRRERGKGATPDLVRFHSSLCSQITWDGLRGSSEGRGTAMSIVPSCLDTGLHNFPFLDIIIKKHQSKQFWEAFQFQHRN